MLHMILIAERSEHGRGVGGSNTVVVFAIIGAVALAILGRFLTHGMDRSRIQKYADGQGWELLSCRWKLLGPGWFGNSRERIYAIQYRDREGRVHSAFAKTSALAGVYLTQDQVEG